MNQKLMRENPCYKCEDRSAIYHSICEKYKAWNTKVIAQRNATWESKQQRKATYPSSIDKNRKNNV